MQILKSADKIYIKWPPAKKFPVEMYRTMREYLEQEMIWDSENPVNFTKLTSWLADINMKYSAQITPPIMHAINRDVLRTLTYRNKRFVANNPARVWREYREVGILQLAKQYKIPPYELMKFLIGWYSYKKPWYEIVNESMLDGNFSRPELKKNLDNGDLQQMRLAWERDMTRAPREVTEESEIAEKRFVTFLRKSGLRLHTQQDLQALQSVEYGQPRLTPDVLLLDDVYINGVQIKWIDYKNMLCMPDSFLQAKIRQQAAKYYTKWGTGAMCFGLGYVAGSYIQGAEILDASWIL